MAFPSYTSGAPAVAQQSDYVFGGTWLSADIITITIGSKSYSVAAGSTSIPNILTNLVAVFNDLDTTAYPEYAGDETAISDGVSKFSLIANEDRKSTRLNSSHS